MQAPIHWNEKHLISFLYISLAVSDFIVSPNERTTLNSNLDELLKGRFQLSDSEKNAIISEVQAFPIADDATRMAIIKELSERIELDWDTYKYVANELDEIAHSDKYVSIEEHSLMFYIRLKFKKDYPIR
jgi:hypothetical protein